MTVTIRPAPLRGRIKAPPSKSMAHRLLICGGLSEGGETRIRGISDSEDVSATLDCLSVLGAYWERAGDSVRLRGTDPRRHPPAGPLECRESGSTLRFFLPLCLLSGGEAVLHGAPALLSRPLSVYETVCREQGLLFRTEAGGVRVGGRLSPGEYRIPGNISSQFISGLLFALPLLAGDSTLSLLPPVESRSYLLLTMEALHRFGVRADIRDERTLFRPGGQQYLSTDVEVEGDYSNAAFFAALRLFGAAVEIDGLNPDSLQGDRAYARYFAMLDRGTPTIHIGDCPDLGPILMAVAAARNGAVFCGTRRLRIKESDRGAAMAEELSKMGVSVTVREDSIVVYPADFHAPQEPLNGHNDHRIVMALATLLTQTGGSITGAEAVRKSLPEYFSMLRSLGAEVYIEKT